MKSESIHFRGRVPAQNENKRNGHRLELEEPVDFPTKYGHFTLYGFSLPGSEKMHTVAVKGELAGAEECPVRVHSECHTGDVFGSLRCDCGEQLDAALRYIAGQPRGAVIYLKQEGRGIGLRNKLRAYALQDHGLDTVEANEQLGFPAEARSYADGAEIIRRLGIRSVVLLTNNPDKLKKLSAEGIAITRREPLVIPPNPHSSRYLTTKKLKMDHLL
jgi:GTP cyclohydrolase II